MNFVTRVIPAATPDERLRAVKRAMEHAASLGVTSVQDMNPSYDDVSAYADLANRGELTARIYAAPMETAWYDQAKLGIHAVDLVLGLGTLHCLSQQQPAAAPG